MSQNKEAEKHPIALSEKEGEELTALKTALSKQMRALTLFAGVLILVLTGYNFTQSPYFQKNTGDVQVVMWNTSGSTPVASENSAPFIEEGAETASMPEEMEETPQGSTISTPLVVNINTADAKTLELLPGIGPVTAANILAYRNENGAFTTKEELLKVSGIGKVKYAQIEKYIILE